LGEHIGDNSTLGTRYPSRGVFTFGSATSALMPQTTEVFPILTTAEPSAVVTEPRSRKKILKN